VPTIFSHAIVATAIGRACAWRRLPRGFWAWSAACAVLPDADVLGFAAGVPYAHMLGHRGLTHSFFFSAVLGGAVSAWLRRADPASDPRFLGLATYFSVITASHALLDALTDGGLGVALLAPFSNERFFFPWTPIRVSPIGPDFFSARGAAVLMSELLWIWIPSAAVSAVVWWQRKNR
jgi:inner membrane protein